MTKEFFEKIENESHSLFGYIVRCDDENAPKEVKHDAYFELWEFEKLSDYIKLCESNNLNYDLAFQEFNKIKDSVEGEITIVSKNHLNS